MIRLATIITAFFLVACSSNQDIASNDYIVNKETVFNFGNSIETTKVLRFSLVRHNFPDTEITFKFSGTPFIKTVDLCPNTGNYNNLISVTELKNGEVSSKYEEAKVDCTSSFKVVSDGKGYILSYDLHLLNGFNTSSIKNEIVYLPHTTQKTSTSSPIQLNQIARVESKSVEGELVSYMDIEITD